MGMTTAADCTLWTTKEGLETLSQQGSGSAPHAASVWSYFSAPIGGSSGGGRGRRVTGLLLFNGGVGLRGLVGGTFSSWVVGVMRVGVIGGCHADRWDVEGTYSPTECGEWAWSACLKGGRGVVLVFLLGRYVLGKGSGGGHFRLGGSGSQDVAFDFGMLGLMGSIDDVMGLLRAVVRRNAPLCECHVLCKHWGYNDGLLGGGCRQGWGEGEFTLRLGRLRSGWGQNPRVVGTGVVRGDVRVDEVII
ncbi:hypothetical protein Tco_0912359 [Tanacetum coccineum]